MTQQTLIRTDQTKPEVLRLWSVTTLIKLALGTSPGLVEHNKRTIAETAFDSYRMLGAYVEEKDRDGAIKYLLEKYWDKLESAAARGTEVHAFAEKLALGVDVEIPDSVRPYAEQCLKFLRDFKPEYLLAESPVYNLTYGYAGTLDAIARIDGQVVLVDMKTTAHGPNAVDKRGKPKARPPFKEVALQLALYRHAELVGLLADRREVNYRRYYTFDREMHTEPMPEVEGAVCLVISPEDYMLVPVDTSERVWRTCLHMLEMARWEVETSKVVFGPPISRAA